MEIRLEKETVETGRPIKGTALWRADADQKGRALMITLRYRIETDLWSSSREVRTIRHVANETPSMMIHTPFQLLVPHDGPITFATQLMNVQWTVSVTADLRGVDETASESIIVVPRLISDPSVDEFLSMMRSV